MKKVDVNVRLREVEETMEEWCVSSHEAIFNLLLDVLWAKGVERNLAWDMLASMTNEDRKNLYLNLEYEI